MNGDHLTDEQMDGLLSMQDPKRDSKLGIETDHLKVCAGCSEEFESLLAVMGDLREAAKASAARHRRSARMPEPLSFRTARMPRAAFAGLAAAALLCIAGPLAVRHQPTRIARAGASLQQTQGAVSDAQLLSEVQSDVSSQVPQAMLPLTASVAFSGATASTSSLNY